MNEYSMTPEQRLEAGRILWGEDKKPNGYRWYCAALGAYPGSGHCSEASWVIHPDRHIKCGWRLFPELSPEDQERLYADLEEIARLRREAVVKSWSMPLY